MKTLVTDRLLIRPFTMDDLEDAHRILDVELQWAGEGVTLQGRRELIESYQGEYRLGRHIGHAAIVLRETGQLIGWFRIGPRFGYFGPSDVPREKRFNTFEPSIGYALTAAARGHGYATEAARAAIAHLFDGLRFGRVVAETDAGNHASLNVMRKLGMTIAISPADDWPQRVFGSLEAGKP